MPGPAGRRSAGPLASPSTTTRPTTCSRSSTWPCSPGTSAGTDPGSSRCEAEGTVTSSERRVQRVRKALEPPPGVRDDIEIICEIARRLDADWGNPSAEDLWNELRTLSPMHAGMSYQRLEELGGIQWPCYDEQHPGEMFLHARLWEEDPAKRGAPAPFTPVHQEDPLDELSAEFPIRLTTGRRLDSFNTGVQSSQYTTPMRRPET